MLPIVDAISGFMSGVVKPVLDKFVPDAKDRLEAEQAIFKGAQDQIMGQIDINKLEAASPSLFVAGWRPFVGWTCAATFAYVYIVKDFLTWGMTVVGLHLPPMPGPDPSIMLELLYAILGVGGLRTFEKIKGVARP